MVGRFSAPGGRGSIVAVSLLLLLVPAVSADPFECTTVVASPGPQSSTGVTPVATGSQYGAIASADAAGEAGAFVSVQVRPAQCPEGLPPAPPQGPTVSPEAPAVPGAPNAPAAPTLSTLPGLPALAALPAPAGTPDADSILLLP